MHLESAYDGRPLAQHSGMDDGTEESQPHEKYRLKCAQKYQSINQSINQSIILFASDQWSIP